MVLKDFLYDKDQSDLETYFNVLKGHCGEILSLLLLNGMIRIGHYDVARYVFCALNFVVPIYMMMKINQDQTLPIIIPQYCV